MSSILETISAISARELAASAARARDLVAGGMHGLGRAVVDLVYPPACLVCYAATAEPRALCASCWGRLRLIERPYCERLGTPFSVDIGKGLLSPAAIANPPVYERARAVARYDDVARALAHRLKYGDRLDLAATIGGWMARAGAELLAEADLIVPVPLHRRRLWARRFNQAALLADAVGRRAGKRVDAFLLARRRHTRPQVGLSRAERQSNLSGAFLVPEEAKARLADLRVLLVDDVLTTGSTADMAARALLRGGAKAVDVLVFARVVHDGFATT
ncbi:comF family protein [Rhizobiales bacterium GAS191]|nr:comF family protein [Rhizobiales bacterium GAS113]SEC10288.1 comF family protein [Rhizobiales bacterium GAS191]SED09908.1 comF family protein [Rhizobiales bacterium GAS188]